MSMMAKPRPVTQWGNDITRLKNTRHFYTRRGEEIRPDFELCHSGETEGSKLCVRRGLLSVSGPPRARVPVPGDACHVCGLVIEPLGFSVHFRVAPVLLGGLPVPPPRALQAGFPVDSAVGGPDRVGAPSPLPHSPVTTAPSLAPASLGSLPLKPRTWLLSGCTETCFL